MVHPVQVGKRTRMSFAKVKDVTEMPNLIEVQLDSYEWFLKEGLLEVFDDINPISNFTGNLVLEFVDYKLDMDNIKYSVEECKERDSTYAAPLKVSVRLTNNDTGEIKEQEVFMGDFPLMTEQGTFIINGAERVVVSQLVRSPGVYYSNTIDKSGKKLFASTVIPNRGAWLEYETDSNDVIYVRIDKTRKLPISILARAMGYGSDQELLEYFGEEERFKATIEKDNTKTREEALLEIYKRLRPGEPPTVDSAVSLIDSLFFDAKRYDLSRVGRYKFNRKLAINLRLINQIAAVDIINPSTGEVMVEQGEKISREMAEAIQCAGINSVDVLVEDRVVRVIGNYFVDINKVVPFDISDLNIREAVHYPTLMEILDNYDDEATIKEDIKKKDASKDVDKKDENKDVKKDSELVKHSYKDEYINKLNSTEEGMSDLDYLYKSGTNGELVEAEYTRLKRWDNMLNEIYSLLKTQLPESEMNELKSKQRSWIEYRDKTAENEASENSGGSLYNVVYNGSLARLTKERCYELVNTYMK